MQTVLPIKAGKLLPSTVIRKLGSYSRQNRFDRAFRGLGVIRTVYLLRLKERSHRILLTDRRRRGAGTLHQR